MKCTQVLPESYVLHGDFNPARFKKAVWVSWLLGFLVAVASFACFRNLARMLRPEFQPANLHFDVPTLERLRGFSRVLIPLAVIFVVHESIHALLLWMFTRERPKIVVALKEGGGICVRLPSWYLPRNAFLAADLAPVCLLTLAGLLLLPVVPQAHLSLLVFCLAVHLAGSTADITSSAFVFLLPPSAYVTTDGAIYVSGSKRAENVPVWKQRLRSFMERILARLE
jgi:hypothetical protein